MINKLLNLLNRYRIWVLFLLLYSISFGVIIINPGVFWDDWMLYKINPADVMQLFIQHGDPWEGLLHVFLMSLPGSIWIYHFLVFFLYLFAAFFLERVLKALPFVDEQSRYIIVLIFGLLPVNFARIACIVLPYAVCYFLFFLGFWLTTLYFNHKRITFRIASLCTLFVSFILNSLLFFYLLILLMILYQEFIRSRKWNDFIKRSLSYIDYLMLPILFFAVKNIFFHPFGIYQNYNQLSLAKIAQIPFQLLSALGIVVSKPLLNSLKTFFLSFNHFNLYGFLLVLLLFSLICLWKRGGTEKRERIRTDLFLILFGTFAVVCGLFPYVAVGLIPEMGDWSSRHLMLAPLGVAFMINYFLKPFSYLPKLGNQIKIAMVALILTAFTFYNYLNYTSFIYDWAKQQSIIENFRYDPIIKSNTTFLVSDQTLFLNSIHRSYRDYEYSGILYSAFGDKKRYVYINTNQVDFDAKKKYFPFFMSDYEPHKIQYLIKIKPGEITQAQLSWPQLVWWSIFEKKIFAGYVKKIVRLELVKME